MKKLYDISMTYQPDMVIWPGHPPFTIEPVSQMAEGASSNVSLLHMGTHSGTHIDAPRHFIEGRPGVDSIPAEVLIGHARLFQLPDVKKIDGDVLERLDFEGIERVIFGTRNSFLLEQTHTTDYVSITGDGAQYLMDKRIILVGIDYLSIEEYKKEGYPTHHVFLESGVVIVEGLDLRGVPEDDYELICLPLKICDSDGAPARVVLKEL